MQEQDLNIKFNTCKFRSTKEEEIGEFSCCSNNTSFGFICFRRDIEGLLPEQCIECNLYKEIKNL